MTSDESSEDQIEELGKEEVLKDQNDSGSNLIEC